MKRNVKYCFPLLLTALILTVIWVPHSGATEWQRGDCSCTEQSDEKPTDQSSLTHAPVKRLVQEEQPYQGQEAPGPISILIDSEKRTLTAYAGGKVWRSYPVCLGTPKTPTPVGEWKVNHLDRDWGNGFGPRFMGLSVPWGKYGIHGTNKPWSIGNYESHGCIRMFNENVIELYQWVKLGTPVKITGPAGDLSATEPEEPLSTKTPPCPQVVSVQLALKKIGYYPYDSDSWFGILTELSVRQFQACAGLSINGTVDKPTYRLLKEKVEQIAASETK